MWYVFFFEDNKHVLSLIYCIWVLLIFCQCFGLWHCVELISEWYSWTPTCCPIKTHPWMRAWRVRLSYCLVIWNWMTIYKVRTVFKNSFKNKPCARQDFYQNSTQCVSPWCSKAKWDMWVKSQILGEMQLLKSIIDRLIRDYLWT